MSSTGLWAQDQGSRPHQRVRRTSMQAAKLSEEDGVSSSQPPELQDEPSQAKTAKRCMLVSRDEVPWLASIAGLALVLAGLALASNMFPLWLQEGVKTLLVRMTMLTLVLLLLMMILMLLHAELEDKSSQAKTAKSGIYMLVSRDDAVQRLVLLGVLLLLLVALLLVALESSIIFPFLLQKLMQQLLLLALVLSLVLVLVLVLVPVQTLHRIMNFCRACMHGRDSRLVKWGPHEWVLDSGAWNHHTSNQALLLEGGDLQSQEMDNKDAPSSGDDASANGPHVQGRGSVRTDCFDFPGVHYVVGDDTRNVVSVSQLARDHGLVTVFEPTSCHVKEKKTGKIVGKGRLRNGMYILDSLHIVGQHIRDRGASGGDRRDGADGGGGGNGDGDSTAEGRGGGGRDGRGGEGGIGARNQEESSGSGAAGGDINEINEEGEGGDEKEIEEMDDNDEDDIEEIGEINGKGEKEDDEKRGGQNSGQLSSRSHTGLFGMSRLDYIWWIVSILCIAACILQPYTGLGAGVKILPVDFHSQLFKTYQELSHQEHNKRLFRLSRFDATRDPTGYRRRHLPARAFPTSTTNAARRPEHFFLDSGAPYHTTWNESILFPYPPHLQNHTKPPTMSLGGIAAGSIAVTRSGYLNGNKIMLDGVLLVLEAQANLVSVGQLSNQYDVNVQMDDEGVVIKKRRDGVQVGGGKMLESHHFVLQYFRPEGLFAHLDTPHPNIFGKSRPGPASWQ